MEHKVLPTARGGVHYWVEPGPDTDSKCLVFTHGVTADHRMFEKQVEFFSGKCTVLLWDVPLHGLSRPYRDFSYHNAAHALHDILLREGIEKAALVGMSMGGYPSQHFALLYPEMTEALVALDTTPLGLGYYSRSDLWWLRQAAPIARWFPGKTLRESMARSVSMTEYSYQTMLTMLEPLSKDEIIEQMRVAYEYFARENRDAEFSCPVLILVGNHDRTGKVMAYCRAWAARTGYPLRIIENARHFSNGDNPAQVNREIADFLGLTV